MSRGAAGLKELYELHGLHGARQRAAGRGQPVLEPAAGGGQVILIQDGRHHANALGARSQHVVQVAQIDTPIANHGIRMFAAAQRTYSRVTGLAVGFVPVG